MATRTKRLRVLHEIYAQLPDVECQGLCHKTCANVPVYPLELEEMQSAARRDLPTAFDGPGKVIIVGYADLTKPCPLLVAHRCSIYGSRPLVCRLLGIAEGLPCPFGCVPKKKITDSDVIKLQRQIERL